MNKTEAYQDWKGLYDDTVYKVWKEEPDTDLRKVSMMLFAIKREFKKITDNLDDNLFKARKKICSPKRKISPKNKKSPAVISSNKENLQVDSVPENYASVKPMETIIPNSPDMFLNESSNTKTALSNPKNDLKNDSIEISDDDDFEITSKIKFDSPEINRKRKNRLRTHKLVDSPSALFIKELVIKTMPSPLKSTEKTSNVSPEKNQVLENVDSPKNTSVSVLDQNISCLTNETPIKDAEKTKNDTLDFSVIPCTPTPVYKSSLSLNHHSKMGSFTSKNLSRNGISKNKKTRNKDKKNSTLTQMFNKQELRKLTEKKKEEVVEIDYDSDSTYYDGCSQPNEKTESENMGVTKMLSMINKTEQADNQDQMPSYDFGEISAFKHCNNIENKQKCSQEDVNKNLDTPKTEETKSDTQKLEINEILAKAQGVPDHQLEAEPVVRGKARKNLPAWTCKECEQFYTAQGMTESQVIALNKKCSKHRGYYRPREDTQEGFWDLTIPTQIKENK